MALDASHEGVQDLESVSADVQAPEAAAQFINIDVESFLARRTPEQKKLLVSRFVVGLSTEDKTALRDLLQSELAKAAEVSEGVEHADAADAATAEAGPEAVEGRDAESKEFSDAEDVDTFLAKTNPEQVKEMAARIVADLSVADKTKLKDYLAEEITKAEAALADEQATLTHEAALGEGVGSAEASEPEHTPVVQSEVEGAHSEDSVEAAAPNEGEVTVEAIIVETFTEEPAAEAEASEDVPFVPPMEVAAEDPHAVREA